MEMPSWVTNETDWHRSCAKIVALAEDLLGGRNNFIETCRNISRYRYFFRAENDVDFSVFYVIDSEADKFPIGFEERKMWNKDALEKEDQKIREFENSYREDVFKAACNIIKKYHENAEQGAAPN
jgi:hypothetical protein